MKAVCRCWIMQSLVCGSYQFENDCVLKEADEGRQEPGWCLLTTRSNSYSERVLMTNGVLYANFCLFTFCWSVVNLGCCPFLLKSIQWVVLLKRQHELAWAQIPVKSIHRVVLRNCKYRVGYAPATREGMELSGNVTEEKKLFLYSGYDLACTRRWVDAVGTLPWILSRWCFSFVFHFIHLHVTKTFPIYLPH